MTLNKNNLWTRPNRPWVSPTKIFMGPLLFIEVTLSIKISIVKMGKSTLFRTDGELGLDNISVVLFQLQLSFYLPWSAYMNQIRFWFKLMIVG